MYKGKNPIDENERILGLYKREIEESVRKSIVYENEPKIALKHPKNDTKYYLYDIGTTEAIYRVDFPVSILNFASYRYPGGGYIRGAIAQEEILCYNSTLYPILSDERFEDYYKFNRRNRNKNMYLNRAIYTPSVLFDLNGIKKEAGVLTCAAPNWSGVYDTVTEEEYVSTLKSRINFAIDVFIENGAKNVILGAWGCGVFGNNPGEVAGMFIEKIQECGYFENVIFAIPNRNSENYKWFERILDEYKINYEIQ